MNMVNNGVQEVAGKTSVAAAPRSCCAMSTVAAVRIALLST